MGASFYPERGFRSPMEARWPSTCTVCMWSSILEEPNQPVQPALLPGPPLSDRSMPAHKSRWEISTYHAA